MENFSSGNKKNMKISVQLLLVLVPMIALFIIVVAGLIFANSKSIIISQSKNALEKESKSNANDIATTMGGIKGYYDAIGDSLETTVFDNAGIKKAMQPGMTKYPDMVHDVYVAFSDKSFIDGGDWVPADDYDPTTRGWYQTGTTSQDIIFGKPDIDMDTKEMVVNGVRTIDFADGRKGVLSTDIFLKNVSSAVSSYSPLGTGKSILFAGSVIIGAPDENYIGAEVADLGSDAFMQEIYKDVSSGKSGEVYEIKGNDKKKYFISIESIAGTNWTLVSYVARNDVLADLNRLSIITVILVIVMLAVSTGIILYLVSRMISKPVNSLTDTITRIADGDFTVDITRGGNNEIGIMNNRMSDYVDRMRKTLGEMKQVTEGLSHEADSSMNAAESMSNQADAQSHSMEQIHEAMEEVARSVTELASNATDLAQAVSEMNEQGDATKAIMHDLLNKAQKGQQDMDNVQKNMGTISVSMTEMNSVVSAVDEAAHKINSIVEMISSISSQTNLLSLNASIEAARAGDAGRGFAVVATEIGNLANDSAKATTEISNIIKNITDQIRMLSARSEASMQDIENSSIAVSETGSTFAEIFASLDQAGHTVNNMVEKMTQVNEIATTVAAIAEEQSASTEEVTATVETAAASAQNVADESRNVDQSAVTVAESSSRIGGFVDSFTI